MPVLNEAGNIEPLIESLSAALDGMRWEVIFVDDGSIDGSVALIDSLSRYHPHIRAIKRFGRRGLASAVVEGAMSSAAPVIAVMGADMQHDETQLPAMCQHIVSDRAGLVVASRYAQGGSASGLSAGRLKGSQLATLFTKRLLRTQCSDPMSGFFAIDRACLTALRPRLSAVGLKILLDILVTGRDSLRVTEHPFQFRYRLSGEGSRNRAGVSRPRRWDWEPVGCARG